MNPFTVSGKLALVTGAIGFGLRSFLPARPPIL
jgi:hypothetical protein